MREGFDGQERPYKLRNTPPWTGHGAPPPLSIRNWSRFLIRNWSRFLIRFPGAVKAALFLHHTNSNVGSDLLSKCSPPQANERKEHYAGKTSANGALCWAGIPKMRERVGNKQLRLPERSIRSLTCDGLHFERISLPFNAKTA